MIPRAIFSSRAISSFDESPAFSLFRLALEVTPRGSQSFSSPRSHIITILGSSFLFEMIFNHGLQLCIRSRFSSLSNVLIVQSQEFLEVICLLDLTPEQGLKDGFRRNLLQAYVDLLPVIEKSPGVVIFQFQVEKILKV